MTQSAILSKQPPTAAVIYRSPELTSVTNQAGAKLSQCHSIEPVEFVGHCGFCFSEMISVREFGCGYCYDCGARLINV